MPAYLSYSIPYERKNIMKIINSDIEVVKVGIGSTFDPDNGKYESGVLIVTLKDEWGTSVSVHLECGIKELRDKFKYERVHEKMLKLYGGNQQKLNQDIKELAKNSSEWKQNEDTRYQEDPENWVD